MENKSNKLKEMNKWMSLALEEARIAAQEDEVPVGAAVKVIFEECGPGQLIHEWELVD